MQAKKVFISYSRTDSKFALKLTEDLQKAGLNIWIDQDGLRPSEPWDTGIENAIKASDCLVVILSLSSVASSNVLNEIDFAIDEKKTLLPVIIEKGIQKPLNIRRLQHIDFTESYNDGFSKISNAFDLHTQVTAKRPFRYKSAVFLAAIPVVLMIVIVLIKTAFLKDEKNQSPGTIQGALVQSPHVIIGSEHKRTDGQNDNTFVKKILEFGDKGIGPGMFAEIKFICVDGKGRIYVGELEGSRVQQFDSQGKFLKQWSIKGNESMFRGIASDRNGYVYTILRGGVYKYEGETGKLLGKTLDGNFSDIQIAADDGVVAADVGKDKILHINSQGELVETIDEATSTQATHLNPSTQIAVDGLGNIYTLNIFDNYISKFSPAGKFLTRFGSKGKGPGQFTYAHGIAVDGYGRVFVSDIRSIKVFDSTGRYLTSFGVDVCYDMIFNDKNELFVATNNEIVKFEVRRYID